MIVKSEDLERAMREREPGKDLIIQGDYDLKSIVNDCIKTEWLAIARSNPLLQKLITKH